VRVCVSHTERQTDRHRNTHTHTHTKVTHTLYTDMYRYKPVGLDAHW